MCTTNSNSFFAKHVATMTAHKVRGADLGIQGINRGEGFPN